MNRSGAIFNTSESQIYTSGNTAQKFKLVFLGDQSVGKTSIINRFIFDTFDSKHNATVGLDFISKTLYYDDKSIKLQIWDTAGQERFRSLIPSYIRDSTIAIIVYDITNQASFNSLSKWIEDVRNERGQEVILFVVGNKLDCEEKRVVSRQVAEDLARENETIYFEVSAKMGDNVHNLFNTIASVLPGNENNRVFATDQNLITSTQGPSQNTPNIHLSSKPQEEQDFQSKKNCNC